jgi:hypothetical protein
MEALAIVTLTLLGFAALLFGSDSLDRRLSLRASRLLAESVMTRDRALPTPTAADVIEATVLAEDEDDGEGLVVPTIHALPEPVAA